MKNYPTFDEFKNEILEKAKNKPKEWRLGQFIFNYIDENYKVARDIQFNNRNVDCFYLDDKIEEFLKEAYDILAERNQF